MTFEQRAIKIVRDFTYQIETQLTEEEVQLLRVLMTAAFEDQHTASMNNLSKFLAEKFKE